MHSSPTQARYGYVRSEQLCWKSPSLLYTYRRMRYFAVLLLLLLPTVFKGQEKATDSYAKESLVFERTETVIRMHADGTGDRAMHVWLRLQSEGAARQFGVLSFTYAAASETPHISLVRVHKPD